jgi:hypothetical protein
VSTESDVSLEKLKRVSNELNALRIKDEDFYDEFKNIFQKYSSIDEAILCRLVIEQDD